MTSIRKSCKSLSALLLLSPLSLSLACQTEKVSPTPAATVANNPAPNPQAELAALDTRTPVPLQPMMAWHQKRNMMGHLEAIQQITYALAQSDWDAVALASKKIESSPQMQQTCEHMGAGANGFTELALEFHQRADAIGIAAREHDVQKVLLATSNTISACTACHATYRQDVVDMETWQQRTGSSHDPSKMGRGMHGGGGGRGIHGGGGRGMGGGGMHSGGNDDGDGMHGD